MSIILQAESSSLKNLEDPCSLNKTRIKENALFAEASIIVRSFLKALRIEFNPKMQQMIRQLSLPRASWKKGHNNLTQ